MTPSLRVCRRDERGKQRSIPRLGRFHELFGVPLHAEHPPIVTRPLDAFDDAIGRARDNMKIACGQRDGLVMKGIHGEPRGSERRRQSRSGVDVHLMDTPVARPVAIVGNRVAALGGNVLHERSAERHIRHLDAATYRKHRKSAQLRGLHQGQLQRVAFRVHVAQGGMSRGTIVLRVDVLAAREDQGVHALEQVVRVARIEEGQNVRARSGTSHGFGVRHVGSHAQNAADGFGRGGDGNGGQKSHWRARLRGRAWALYAKPLPPVAPALRPRTTAPPMFDSFRQSLSDLMDRATPPEERRTALARMKQTLVQAKMGLEDLRGGVVLTRQRLEKELKELETMRRRRGAAAGINDAETLALAEKYETHHTERAEVLKRKLEAQEAELVMVEREVDEMSTEFKRAAALGGATPLGGDADAARAEAEAVIDDGKGVAEEIDALGRAGRRSAREAEAERQLAELKRRMGK